MSSIVVCGDIHGETFWQQIVKQESCLDRMVFMGDYFDPYREISFNDMVDNFYEIIDFKKKYPEQVTLLLGNHDHHYLKGCSDQLPCSRFMTEHATKLRIMFAEQIDLFQVCHIEDGYLFSHAGVTKTWCERNEVDMNDLENSINRLFTEHHDYYTAFKFFDGDWGMYGNHPAQSPFWVRPASLEADVIEGYIQVVGHTNAFYCDEQIVIELRKNNIILTDTCSQCKAEPIDGNRTSYYYKLDNKQEYQCKVTW